jgi:hypothetical protein
MRAEGYFVCAERESASVRCNRSKASDWERFLPISARDLDRLLFLFSHTWVDANSRALCLSSEISIGAGFTLRLGGRRYELKENLPFKAKSMRVSIKDKNGGALQRGHMSSIILLVDGWRLREYRLYRPLVYYTAFGSAAVLEQLRLSTASLAEFGAYRGAVHVVSDFGDQAVAAAMPPQLRDQVSVRKLACVQRPDFSVARYRITEFAEAFGLQPLLYVDTDILFTGPLQPTLIELLFSDRLAAVEESSQSETRRRRSAPIYLQKTSV